MEFWSQELNTEMIDLRDIQIVVSFFFLACIAEWSQHFFWDTFPACTLPIVHAPQEEGVPLRVRGVKCIFLVNLMQYTCPENHTDFPESHF